MSELNDINVIPENMYGIKKIKGPIIDNKIIFKYRFMKNTSRGIVDKTF